MRIHSRSLLISFLILSSGCGSEPTAPVALNPTLTVRSHSAPYTQVDLGTLGGAFSDARDINDSGVIVGYGTIPSGETHAWMKIGATGAMIDMGVPVGEVNSFAQGVNNVGVIVGTSNAGGITPRHAWRWTSGSGFEMLGDLGGGSAQAFKVNDRGFIVGVSSTPAGAGFDHAFLWTPSAGLRDLGTLTGGVSSIAQDINEEGNVVGYGDVPSGTFHPFRWTKHLGMVDIDPSNGGTSGGLAINNSTHRHKEQVVGFSFGAFLWTRRSGPKTIGGLPGFFDSQAEGINDDQLVVGVSDGSNIPFHAWYAKVGGPLVDLTPGSQFGSVAERVNRCGQIVGTVEDTQSNPRATLWDRPCT